MHRIVLALLTLYLTSSLQAAELSYLSGPNPKGPKQGYVEFKAKFKKSGEWAYSSAISVIRRATPNATARIYEYEMKMNLKDSENHRSQFLTTYTQDEGFHPTYSRIQQWDVSTNSLIQDKAFFFEPEHVRSVDAADQKEEVINTDKLTYPSDSIALILMGINFEEQKEVFLRVILRGSGIYNISIKNIGKESIQTPAGSFLCYKLEIRPDLGFFNYLIGFAIPSIYYWQTVDEPYRPIQFEGPIAGPFSEHIQAKAQKIWFK